MAPYPRRLIVLFLIAVLLGSAVALTPQPTRAAKLLSLPDLDSLLRTAQTQGTVRVVIGLNVTAVPEANLSAPAVQAQRAAIRQARADVLTRLAPYSPQVLSTDWIVPFMALRLDAAGLQALASDPRVTTIREDFTMQGGLTESVGIVGAPAAWARGFDGSGYSVAVLDTGSDLSHPFIASKIVGEACFSSSGGTEFSFCPNGQDSQIGPGSSASCTGSYTGTSCSHGTHVAGIAVGNTTDRSGVARNANLVSVQVFTGNSSCGGGQCNYLYWSDTIDALNWVFSVRATYNVAAVNMSLGNATQYATTCDSPSDAQQAIIGQLRAAGVATVVSAMNNGFTAGLAYPACLSNVISVGSTEKNDTVASYSNSATYLSLLAPGSAITSSVIGGGYQAFWGTSMAAPHVAGALAILKQARPTASVSELLSLLQSTGRSITDSRNGIVKPRIQIDKALPKGQVLPIRRVSVASNGAEGNGEISYGQSAVSGDGRYITFASRATNLVNGDTNGENDIFVHDRQTGVTSRVSISSNGTQANTGSDSPVISADGRYIAFQSFADNLVSGDTEWDSDVFVHDRQTGQTSRISLGVDPLLDVQGASQNPAISPDGRFIVFDSAANLVLGDSNGWNDVYIRDRQLGTLTRVSVSSGGVQGNQFSSLPVLSADGRYVAFVSSASNLVSGDTNGKEDVFVHDRQTSITTRVSVATDGTQGNNSSGYGSKLAISADGRFVAFSSAASNLVSGDTNGKNDVFVYDRQTSSIARVSVGSGGSEGNDSSYAPSLSADGRLVAYVSSASNLVSGDTNNVEDIFVHNRELGITSRISVAANGTAGNSPAYLPAISPDGQFVSFATWATNLVPGDTNNAFDVFLAPAAGPFAFPRDTVGVFRPSTSQFLLRNQNTTGPADITAVFGTSSDQPVVGDWNGDGVDTIGIYRNGTFFLKDSNTTAAPVVYSFTLGNPGDLPMAGDWDGDGADGAGTFRPTNGRLFLRNALSTGFADFAMVLGINGDRPVAGDWNGDGFDSPGVYRPSNSQFYLTNQRCNCIVFADYQLQLGVPGDIGFAGDWDGNGISGVGVFRPTNGITFLRNTLTTGFADVSMVYGIANDRPLAGRWSGTTSAPEPADAAPEFGSGR